MDEDTIQYLQDINKQFYQHFGEEFSATRGRIQPGVHTVLDYLEGNEKILDLGCGNGAVADELVKLGHKGTYTGLDLSQSLLAAANKRNSTSDARFLQADLTSADWDKNLPEGSFDVVFAFATLHHIPSIQLRNQIIIKVRQLLVTNGIFIHSNWQFLNSPRLISRIQPWEKIGIKDEDVDDGDYLLDWRRGGKGLRYVHHYSEDELKSLAKETGFHVFKTFYSDGYEKQLGLYQYWTKTKGYQESFN
ncbi:class I SAM-dependent methyltransferase [Chloroflexota bacterium]